MAIHIPLENLNDAQNEVIEAWTADFLEHAKDLFLALPPEQKRELVTASSVGGDFYLFLLEILTAPPAYDLDSLEFRGLLNAYRSADPESIWRVAEAINSYIRTGEASL